MSAPFRRLAAWWFRPRAFEAGLHAALGVPLFRRVLLALARPDPRRPGRKTGYQLPSRDLAGVAAFAARTRRNEALHLLVALPPALLLALGIGGWPVRVAAAATLFLNLWPALLQRHTRARLLAVLARAARRRRLSGSDGGGAAIQQRP